MRPRTPIAVALVLTALTVLTACTSEEPVPVDPAVRTSIEDSTQQAMTAVAEQLGTEISVRRQEWLTCMDALEDGDAEEYVYGLRVELAGQETFEQVAERLRSHFEAAGWTWRDADPTLKMVRLGQGGYIVAASIFVDDGYASITGGAGCIGTIEDVPEQNRPSS